LITYSTNASYCPTCGLSLVPGASHCARCGTPLYSYAPKNPGPGHPSFRVAFPVGASGPYPPPGWPPPVPPAKGHAGLVIGIAIAVVLVLVGGGIGGWWILSPG
jgi:hypothetical protein